MSIVEQIHQEFYTASERILNQVNLKGKILYNLGFTASKDVSGYDPEVEGLKELIAKYNTCYVNNRFITEKEVTRICKKYNLICGPVSSYTGSVPDSKIEQIATFKLHKSDLRSTEYTYLIKYYGWVNFPGRPEQLVTTQRMGHTEINDFIRKKYSWVEWLCVKEVLESSTNTFKELMICAPPDEMNTEGLTKRGVFAFLQTVTKIEDPVVLQPCKGGFLIVAAWGPEASDEDVVNHKMN